MVIMVHSSASSQGSLLDWGDLRLIINKSENLCRRLTIGTKSGNYQQVRNLSKAIIRISKSLAAAMITHLFIGRRKSFPSHRQLIAPSPPYS